MSLKIFKKTPDATSMYTTVRDRESDSLYGCACSYPLVSSFFDYVFDLKCWYQSTYVLLFNLFKETVSRVFPQYFKRGSAPPATVGAPSEASVPLFSPIFFYINGSI
jgi:hypothetical protein